MASATPERLAAPASPRDSAGRAIAPRPAPWWIQRLPDTMFGRTMLLIAALIAFGHYAWVSVSERLETPVRAYWAAHEAVSIVNLTRAALLASHANRRLMLLAELSQSESIQLYPLEMLPMEGQPHLTPLQQGIVEELRKELGPTTLVGFDRHNINGLWVSFDLGPDRYWLVIPRAPTRNDRSLVWAGWSALVLVLSMLGAAMIVRRLNQPLANLANAAQRLASGSRPERLKEGGPREIATVTQAFNSMARNLERAESDRAMLLAGVSHDLRTPLTRLRGTAELALQPGSSPEQAREALADCVEESERVLRMLNTLMDVAEAEAGMMRLERRPVDLRDLAREAAELYEFVAQEKDVRVEARLPREPAIAFVDPVRTRQVIANLLDNAIKYTDAGGHVVVEVEDGALPSAIAVCVRDDGIGIPPEETDRIWTRLYRGDKSRSRRGLGLGLSLVKAVVEAHGGGVAVQSTPGQGSTFTVWLPRKGA